MTIWIDNHREETKFILDSNSGVKMGRKKEVEGTEKATFKLTKETLDRLERVILLYRLKGKKIFKSQIVEEALKEKLDKMEKELGEN